MKMKNYSIFYNTTNNNTFNYKRVPYNYNIVSLNGYEVDTSLNKYYFK